MPKIVEHDARRTLVSKAAWRVILRDGIDRATIRSIAQELGLTTTVVTHYFKDKDALMAFTLDTINDHLGTRQSRTVRSSHGLKRLEQLVLAALPVDEKGRTEWTIWMAFVGYAVGRETLLEAHRRRAGQNLKLITDELEALRSSGDIASSVNVALEARTILALVDGLGLNMVLDPEGFGGPLSVERLEGLIAEWTERLRP